MKRNITKVLLLFLFSNVIASTVYPQNWEWSNHITGTGNLFSKDIVIDSEGNVIVAIQMIGEVSLIGTDPLVVEFADANTPLLLKFNQDGGLIWSVKIGDKDHANMNSIVLDQFDNIYITGGFLSANADCTFGSTDANTISISGVGQDTYIAKYNSLGEVQWAKNVATSTALCRAEGLTLDSENNILINGFFRGGTGTVIDFGGGNTFEYIGSTNLGNAFVAKFTNSGDFIWANHFSSNTNVRGSSIAQATTEGTYALFTIEGNFTFEGTDPIVSLPDGALRWAIVKLDNSGNPLWLRTVSSVSQTTIVTQSLVSNTVGNVFIGGSISGTTTLTNSDDLDEISLVSNGSFDVFGAMYNSDGDIVWAKSFGSTSIDRVFGIAVNTSQFSIYGLNANVFYIESDTIPLPTPTYGVFNANFDYSGNLLSQTFLSPVASPDRDGAITIDENGNSFIAGFFSSTSIDIGSNTFINGGNKDAFLAKHINIHLLPTITPIINNSSAAGSIDLEIFGGGEAPYTYTLTLVGGDVVGTGTYSVPLNFTGLNGGVYRLEVVDNLGRQITKFYHIFEPIISTVDPASELNYCEGQPISVELEVNIPAAEAYQWLKDGVALPGEELTTYTAIEAGIYSIEVTVDGVVGISNEIEIYVEGTPLSGTLTKTPDVVNVCENDMVSGSLNAGSGGVEDILQYRTYDGEAWTDWADYTTESPIETVGISEVQIQTYRANQFCDPASVVTVSWVVEPTPVSGTLARTPDVDNVCEGTEVSATLTSGSGGNGTDELEYSTDGGIIWEAYVSGETISTAGVETVEVRTRRMADFCDPAAYYTVLWTIEPTPVSGALARTPDVDNVCEGTEVSATLTSGSGGNGTDELEYSTDGGIIWEAYVSGETISTAGVETVEVRTRRKADYCDNSEYITVIWQIDPQTNPGTLSGGTNICEGSTSAELTLTGYTGSVIRWEKSIDPFDTWSEIAHTEDTYTSNPLVVTTRFRAVVQSGACEAFESNHTEVEVTPAPIAGTINGDNLICSGSGPILTLEGYDGQIIKWSHRLDGSTTWQSTAETNAIFYAPPITQKTQYRVEVDRGVCSSVFTDVFTVDVEQPTEGGEVVGGTSICEGQNSSTLSLNNHIGDVIKWQSSTNGGGSWVDITHTSETYTSGVLTQTTQFRAVVQNGVCGEESSAATEVTVNEYPTPTITNLSDLEVCTGESISVGLSVDIESAESYQWFKDDVEIAGATQSTYTATQVGTYSVDVVVNGCLGSSNELTVSTIPNPTPVVSTTDDLAFCQGEAISVGFTVDITDATSYQWMLDGSPISGATEATYTATEPGAYSVEVEVNTCSGISNEQTVVVNPLPTVIAPDDFAVCAGESVTLSGSGADSYTWDNGVDNGVAFTPTATTTYTVTGTDDQTGCSSTDEVTVAVKNLPTPEIINTDNLEVCSGDEISVDLLVDITNAQTYQWMLDGTAIPDANAKTFTANEAGLYSVEVTVDGCTAQSNELVVVVVDLPTPVISAGSSLNICEGNDINVELTVDIDEADAYQWLYNGQIIGSGTQQTYTATVSGTYSAEAVVGGCVGVSNELTVVKVQNPKPKVTTSDELTYYFGEIISVLLEVDITDADAYRWFKDDVEISGANASAYTATQPGSYSVEVLVNGCAGISNLIDIVQYDNLLPEISTADPLAWCADEQISVILTVNPTADSYQWYVNNEVITDATSESYTATAAGEYKAEVTLGSQTEFSNVIVVVSTPNPTPSISTNDPLSWCTGSDINVQLNADIADADAYQWFKDDAEITSATSPTYTAVEAGLYSVEVVVNGCAGVSDQITITQSDVLQPVLTAEGETVLCEGDEVAVLLSADITGATYVWMLNGTSIDGEDQSTYTATDAGEYTVEVSNASCSGVSNTVEIVVNPVPNPVISSTDDLIWEEGAEINVTFTVDITDADAYQWLKDRANIADAGESSYTATEVGKYSVLVTKANCVGESNELTIEISTTPMYDVTFTVLNSSDDPVANAEVEIEGESPVHTNASGIATFKMPNGSYNFDVNAADYQEYQGTFTVSDEDLAVLVKLVAVGVDFDKLSQLNLFPNPFNSKISISDPEAVKRVVITNIAGQKVMDIQLDGADRINTHSLSSGVYLIRIISHNDESVTFRMVKDN